MMSMIIKQLTICTANIVNVNHSIHKDGIADSSINSSNVININFCMREIVSMVQVILINLDVISCIISKYNSLIYSPSNITEYETIVL